MIITPEEAQKKLRVQADRAFRALIFEAVGRLKFRTPVGDPTYWKSPPPKGYVGGRARGNWHTSVGRPEFHTDKPPDPNGVLMEAQAKAVLAGVTSGDRVYVTNGLPYMPRLEYEEWSRQAPHGMVRVTLAELERVGQDVAAKIRAAQ